ncbi:hypothetical protein GIB67_034629 [Kingdonia uniflora]|uniref:Peptidase A1 domain-containing protein n=1 Tax=Kingdonia uniflora TaxID=39325 RepID=A0A7J7P696_9MAGN|nr:hypothetical protein GIB67_034629 [Kingdonia uniflora]
MALKIAFLLFFIISIVLPTRNAFEICSTDDSDLSIVHIYGKCSPFALPHKQETWFDTVVKMANEDPGRVAYLSTLIGQKSKTSVPVASGHQVLNTAKNEAIAPTITLHFTEMDLKLPMENTLIHSSAGSLACLSMAAAPSNVNSVLNIIANLQQQNLRILFDVANSRLGIARELCN